MSQLALPVQQMIQSQDRDLPVSDVLTMDQLLGQSTLDQSFDATLITSLAVLSLFSRPRAFSVCCLTSWLSARARSGSA